MYLTETPAETGGSGGTCRHTTSRAEGGFTLVELMVAIAILGVITVPLAGVVLSALRNQQATADRLALSHDAQISAAYFAADIGAVGVRDYTSPAPAGSSQPFQPSIQLGAAYNAGGRVCGTAATPVAALRLLADDWNGSASPPTVGVQVVAYYLAGSALHRIKCTGTATPESDVVLAHNVDAATLAVTCSSTCTAAAVPQQVTLAFTVRAPATTPYQITMTGQRRQT